jgi:hypothetical protein
MGCSLIVLALLMYTITTLRIDSRSYRIDYSSPPLTALLGHLTFPDITTSHHTTFQRGATAYNIYARRTAAKRVCL